MPKPTLLYSPARGRAEVIRLVLAEAGVDYDGHHVGKGTPPAGGRATDLADLKASGVLAFGAVPASGTCWRWSGTTASARRWRGARS